MHYFGEIPPPTFEEEAQARALAEWLDTPASAVWELDEFGRLPQRMRAFLPVAMDSAQVLAYKFSTLGLSPGAVEDLAMLSPRWADGRWLIPSMLDSLPSSPGPNPGGKHFCSKDQVPTPDKCRLLRCGSPQSVAEWLVMVEWDRWHQVTGSTEAVLACAAAGYTLGETQQMVGGSGLDMPAVLLAASLSA